jgi:DNA-binding response OmpR family regulator
VLLAWQAGAQVYLTRPPKTEEVVNFVNHVARMWPNDSSQEVCAK